MVTHLYLNFKEAWGREVHLNLYSIKTLKLSKNIPLTIQTPAKKRFFETRLLRASSL